MTKGNIYRTYNSSELEFSQYLIGTNITLAGWIDAIRDHGGVSFLDLRDHYGFTQIVIENKELLIDLKKEQCVSIAGMLRNRDASSINTKIKTGTIELLADKITILGDVLETLPFEVSSSKEIREDLRLKYRFLDLRNPAIHENIILRSEVTFYLREQMRKLGFLEITTPILTASSPEGARDYIVPSRKHKGRFYALPQAPQIFKQLLMVSGFDKYFQIAPCFRDEDARADRSPGEFYQLDFEMAFATQEDVFAVTETVLYNLFTKFGNKTNVTPPPFTRITFEESMLKYGTDKPDLRNPLSIIDLSNFFNKCDFVPFKNKCVRGIKISSGSNQSKSFREEMEEFAKGIGMKGLGYITVAEDMTFKGPIDKFIPSNLKSELLNIAKLEVSDLLYFIADNKNKAPSLAGQIRTKLGEKLNIIDKDSFKFCFITDYPMYEMDEETNNWIFKHNPFSMPQGGYDALISQRPDEVLAYQYDIVCNGVELSSGAVRNHEIETMKKAFEIAGYSINELTTKFPSLYNAFKYGPPPHAGMAPGIDRILMLLAEEANIREVIAFPMNKNAQDLLMGAPNEVTELQLREVHIKIR